MGDNVGKARRTRSLVWSEVSEVRRVQAGQEHAFRDSHWSFPHQFGGVFPKLPTEETVGDSKASFNRGWGSGGDERAACKGRFITLGSLYHLLLLGDCVWLGHPGRPGGEFSALFLWQWVRDGGARSTQHTRVVLTLLLC